MRALSRRCSLSHRSAVTFGAFRRIELTRDRIPDDRIQPGHDGQTSAGMFAAGYGTKGRSDADKTADDCEHCEHNKGHPHRRRRLMRNVRAVCVVAVLLRVPVCRDVMSDVFVNWSNVLAGFVSWTIAG